jgi:hypothetical protein
METLIEYSPEVRRFIRRPKVSGRNSLLILLLVWTFGALYSGALLKRGWVPHDEGTIGQSAQRVLDGELPHRDFDELYTGGLSYLNALSFRAFGENLASPRFVLFGFFLAWIPAVFFVARRFVGAVAAGAVTLLSIAYSVPNYSAAVPSWYNLFFATFGLAAIFQFLSSERRLWLFIGGLAGGISFLFKLSGLYFVAGVLLFFVFREQEQDRTQPTHSHARYYSAFVVLALAAFITSLYSIARQNLSGVAVFEFIVPGEILALLCMWRQLSPSSSPAPIRFKRLFRLLIPFMLGVALPIALFLIPYLRSGSASDFINGVFILPGRRLAFASRRPLGYGLNKLLTTGALLFLLWSAYSNRLRFRTTHITLGLALAVCLLLSKFEPKLYAAVWAPLLLLIPFCVIAATMVLLTRNENPFERQKIFVVIAVTATCTLIQVPFSVGIYFCYVAPLLALSLVAIFSSSRTPSRILAGLLIAFYFGFAIFRVTPSFIHAMSYAYQPDPQNTELHLPRAAGLRVDAREAELYDTLVPFVNAHSGQSDFIYAAPDCPEVYFLTGKKNPTRMMFDFFDDAKQHDSRVTHAIDSSHVNVIAIFQRPPFSPPVSAELMQELRERYPLSHQIGRFEVRWKP